MTKTQFYALVELNMEYGNIAKITSIVYKSLVFFFNLFKKIVMDLWPVLRFWPRRKNGHFSVPALRFASVVKSGSFFWIPGPSDRIS